LENIVHRHARPGPAECDEIVRRQNPRLNAIGEHDADVPRQLARRQQGQRITEHEHLAVQRRLHTREGAHQRRFAGAVRAEQTDQLAGHERRRQEEVERRTGAKTTLSIGTLYRSIARMCDEGLIVPSRRRPAASADDPRRNYYRITERGRQALHREAERLDRLVRWAHAVKTAPRLT
jgi:hypothetical protein